MSLFNLIGLPADNFICWCGLPNVKELYDNKPNGTFLCVPMWTRVSCTMPCCPCNQMYRSKSSKYLVYNQLIAHTHSLRDHFQIHLQAEHILDLQKQLTLMSVEPKVGVNGGSGGDDSITSVAPVDKVCLTCCVQGLTIDLSFLVSYLVLMLHK